MLTVVLYFIIHVCLILAGSAHDNKSSAQSDQELVSQVKDLKSCLLQRDNEIAILVNMVKKGKKNADAGGGQDQHRQQEQQRQWDEEQEQAQMKQAAEQRGGQQQQQQQRQRNRDRDRGE